MTNSWTPVDSRPLGWGPVLGAGAILSPSRANCWAECAAIGARQTDAWFRQMPLGWKLEDGLAWTRYAMQLRDRTMADNLGWVRHRLGPRGRVLVYAASGYLASTLVQVPTQPKREMIAMGSYVKDR